MGTGGPGSPGGSARPRLAGVGALLWLLLPVGEASALDLRAVALREREGATEVVLRLDGAPAEVEVALLPNQRLVVDLPGATAALPRRRVPGRGPCLTRIRIGEHPDYTRVVLDLAGDCAHRHRVAGGSVIVRLVPRPGGAPPSPDLGAPAAPRAESGVRTTRGVLLPATGAAPSPELATGGVLLPGQEAPRSGPDAAAPAEDGESPRRALEGSEPTAPAADGAPAGAAGEGPSGDEPAEAAPPTRVAGGAREAPVPEGTGTSAPTSAPPSPEPSPSPTGAPPSPEPSPTPTATAAPLPTRTLRPIEVREPSPPPDRAPAPAAGSPAERAEARVSIEFEDADVRTVLDLLARAGGREVIFRPEVKGRVGIKAVDRPWRAVFDQVLERAELEAVEHDGLLLISPARP